MCLQVRLVLLVQQAAAPVTPVPVAVLASVPVADPRQRRRDRAINTDEIPSVIHPISFKPVHLPFRQVKDNHFVREEL